MTWFQNNMGLSGNTLLFVLGTTIKNLNTDPIVLVEQKLPFARAVGETFALMEKGQVMAVGNMPDLNEELVNQYLAV